MLVIFVALATFLFSRRRLKSLARQALRTQLESDNWMAHVQDASLDGAASSTAENQNVQEWLQAPVSEKGDNTEGLAAFHDLDPRLFQGVTTVANIGSGASDAAAEYLQARYPSVTRVHALDPFRRSPAHNMSAQQAIRAQGGVDLVTSMSVLNIIPTLSARMHHLATLNAACRPGGRVVIKVWAGTGAVRGTDTPTVDSSRRVYQANRWASHYLDEVAAVFGGRSRVRIDDARNLIVAER